MSQTFGWKKGGHLNTFFMSPGVVAADGVFAIPANSPRIARTGGTIGATSGLIQAQLFTLTEGAPNTIAVSDLVIVTDAAALGGGADNLSQVDDDQLRINISGAGIDASDALSITYVTGPDSLGV